MMNQGSHYNKNSSTSTKSDFNKNTLRKHISRSILECFLATAQVPGKHAIHHNKNFSKRWRTKKKKKLPKTCFKF